MIGPALILLLAGEPNVVAVTGTAERTVVADAATVSVSVNVHADRQAAALEAVRTSIARTLAILQKTLPDPKSYRIKEPSVYPEYAPSLSEAGGFGRMQRPVTGYRAVEGIDVRVDDLGKLTDFVKATSQTGAYVLIVYGIRDASSLRRSVLREAFEDARTKAEESAQAAGLRLGEVVLIEAGNGPSLTSPPESEPMVLIGSGRELEVARINVMASAKLTVHFRLLK